jgi:hypothetical protein
MVGYPIYVCLCAYIHICMQVCHNKFVSNAIRYEKWQRTRLQIMCSLMFKHTKTVTQNSCENQSQSFITKLRYV